MVPVHVSPGVGEGLQDHLQVRHVFRARLPTMNDQMGSIAGRLVIGWRYLTRRTGALTVSAGNAGAFLRTDERLASPDIQLLFIPFSTAKMGTRLDPFSGFTISCGPLRPKSRGSVRAVPAIRCNLLATRTDEATVVANLRAIRQGAVAEPLAGRTEAEVTPGLDRDTDAELLAYARATGSLLYHPTCSARMGVDPLTVVDAALWMRGVADGSIMPSVVLGNTNAVVIMIGEKTAELMLAGRR